MAEKIKDLGLEFDFSNPENCSSFINYYEELARHIGNFDKVEEGVLDTFHNFFRLGYYNPNSDVYIAMGDIYPNIDQVVDAIHRSGGKAFLAHPFEYRFPKLDYVLNTMYDNTELDGIECYYANFSSQQTDYLLDFARQKNLLVSGGTDFHGSRRPQISMGVGRGNLNISNDILDNWLDKNPVEKMTI